MNKENRTINNDQLGRREFLSLIAAGAAATALPGWAYSAAAETKQKRLNFVVIMGDDCGPEMYGCYGNKQVKTPNLNKLAETGVMFRTCWATPICSPTRAMIMTGRYGFRTGYYHNSFKIPQDKSGLNFEKSNLTFARILRQAGYATAIAGKWQMIAPIDSAEHGFDEHCYWAGEKHLPEGTKFNGLKEPTGRFSRYWRPCIVRNGGLLPTKAGDFGPDIFTGFVIDFVKRHKNKQPFLAYYPMTLTHGVSGGRHPTTPLTGRPGKITGGTRKGCVEYADVLVGRIVKALEESGLRENTIIIYTTDNGSIEGGKNSATERGARVPMIVNCPGIVKGRGASDELTDFSDILPTLIDFAGARVPKGYILDGRSLAPYLRGETERHREWIFSYLATARMLRDKRWLLEAADEVYGCPKGRFYDCGNNRNGSGYKEVTGSKEPEVVAARARFEKILANLPAPDAKDQKVQKVLKRYRSRGSGHKLQ